MVGKRFRWKRYWLSVRDVELLLGWHRSRVRRWMEAGKLPFVRDDRGHARFPRREIERLAEEELGRIVHGAPAKVAANAFGWFAQGKTWQEVVILLSKDGDAQPVEVVRKLHVQFLDEGRRETPSTVAPRGKQRRSMPPEVESTEPEHETPWPLDADAWCREQEAIARSAQDALEREERAWREDRHDQRNEHSRRHATEEEPAPLSDRILQILQLLASRNVTG